MAGVYGFLEIPNVLGIRKVESGQSASQLGRGSTRSTWVLLKFRPLGWMSLLRLAAHLKVRFKFGFALRIWLGPSFLTFAHPISCLVDLIEAQVYYVYMFGLDIF